MPKTPQEIRLQIQGYAEHISGCAEALLARRSFLEMSDLQAAQNTLSTIRKQVSPLLSGRELQPFNQNMDAAEDYLAGLIRRVNFSQDKSNDFTSEVRQLHTLLRATAGLIWAFSPLLIAFVPPVE